MSDYDKIRAACRAALASIKKAAPIDTGNLRQSIKIIYGRGEIRIYVSGSDGDPRKKADGMAPYMKYTNEPWGNFAPPLRGKKNPNEGWFDRSVHDAASKMASMLGGELVKK